VRDDGACHCVNLQYRPAVGAGYVEGAGRFVWHDPTRIVGHSQDACQRRSGLEEECLMAGAFLARFLDQAIGEGGAVSSEEIGRSNQAFLRVALGKER
jgi:hypothetical protein